MAKPPGQKIFLFKEVITVDPDDVAQVISTINEVYGDPFEYPTLDLDVYKVDTQNEWESYIGKP